MKLLRISIMSVLLAIGIAVTVYNFVVGWTHRQEPSDETWVTGKGPSGGEFTNVATTSNGDYWNFRGGDQVDFGPGPGEYVSREVYRDGGYGPFQYHCNSGRTILLKDICEERK